VTVDFSEPLAVVCHDAGGANQILAMLRAWNPCAVRAYLDGPALQLWRKSAQDGVLCDNVEATLDGVATLISGTGWGSDLDHEARKAARTRGVRSIAVLDNWVNYRERFVRGGEMVLPDEIWVVDEYAMAMAAAAFPSVTIRQKRDVYADEQLRGIAPPPDVGDAELLYLLEPARSNWSRNEPGEFQALRYFLARFTRLNLPPELIIRLRPHPSDDPAKYDEFLGSCGACRIVLDSGNLAASMSRARWVAGCQTYALTLALRSGRKVFCTLPPWAPPCTLPHAGLVHVKLIDT
jgi:hypothetical protein